MVKVIPSIIIALLCLATNEISADNQPKGITGHSNDPCELPEAKGVRLMVKTNLFNDILLTPDIGFEIGFSPHWSLSLQGATIPATATGVWQADRPRLVTGLFRRVSGAPKKGII